jgi:hypothetical protein
MTENNQTPGAQQRPGQKPGQAGQQGGQQE